MEVIEVSLVSINERTITQVAAHCVVSEEEVRQYLKSDEQNDALLNAFLFFGVGPVNKLPSWCVHEHH
jgi:hypothetical protein